MTAHPAPLPGLATDEELAVERVLIECRECHRPLTAREARLHGIGDACAARVGERTAPGLGRFAVEQDEIPGTQPAWTPSTCGDVGSALT